MCVDPHAGLGGIDSGASGTHSDGPSSSSASSSGRATIPSGEALSEELCDLPPLPERFQDQWMRYNDWTCRCAFFVPSSPSALPPPPVWEPCGPAAGSLDCKVMNVDWTKKMPAIALTFFERDAAGNPLLAFRRLHRDAPLAYTVDLITEPDGPVRTSFMQLFYTKFPDQDPGCIANMSSLSEGRYVLKVWGNNAYGSGVNPEHRGALGGSVDDLKPAVLAHYKDGAAREYVGGSKWLAERHFDSTLLASPWDMTKATFVTSATVDPDGLASDQILSRGDAIFFSTSVLLADGINVWDPIHGARTFIRWVGDYTKGAADLGTDGVDLVWTYGEGKLPSDIAYPVRSIMTAPYTTDPAAVVARRLRSSPFQGVGNFTWVVGCGHAANVAAANDVLVVRLSDGVSWILPTAFDLNVTAALGFTCDEIFVRATVGETDTLARIRLDSLGAGTPPD
jgi:hypothetical protein